MEYLLCGLGLSMTVIVAVQVFSRYVLNHSLFWSEELARYMLVWLSFLGATAAYRRNVHPGIDVITNRLPASMRKGAAILAHSATITLFGIMIVYGFKFSYFVRLQITPALHIPKWIILGIIPLSGLIFLCHGLNFLLNEFTGSGRDD
ncbi:TRAP transporter small permease [Thermodesulfobacteriota bacterium]